MGICNGLRLIATKAMNRDSSDMPADSISLRGRPLQKSAPPRSELRNCPHHRDKISRILTDLGKFAVDSAVSDSLKGVTGGIQVHKIVKDKLREQSSLPATNENNQPEHALVMQEMQAKMENIQEELSFIKQKNEASIQHAKEFNSSKESSAGATEGSVPPKTDVKKDFIRSRL